MRRVSPEAWLSDAEVDKETGGPYTAEEMARHHGLGDEGMQDVMDTLQLLCVQVATNNNITVRT